MQNNNITSKQQSSSMVKFELDELNNWYFTRLKACQSLQELLEEIETSDEDADSTELKKSIWDEIDWLDFEDEGLFAGTYDEEISWLKARLLEVIGSKDKPQISNAAKQNMVTGS